ncbi:MULTISPECIES: FecR domain-containing protein [unclassified Phenylobacterium]|uniref:FecR family protein n=1 Tax=unclassified Phenylobacterium TaxID=2640670 RepID=UPI00083ADC8A|nr:MULTISPECIES: FecR domain-containing protein [unclassified Phenylobacterium]
MSESADRAIQASEWFTVMTRPSVTPEDLAAFRTWRRAPENAEAFRKVQQAWEAAGGLADRPAMVAATEAALARYPAKPVTVKATRRRFVLAPLALGAASAVVAAGIYTWREAEPSYATAVGGQRLEVLSDGSRVRLNTDTKLRVVFRGAERRVVLERGQAFFEVAHDAERPFIVVADGTQVRALGTKFDVRREGDAVRVTLAQGRVEVKSEGKGEAMLAPGEAVVADRRGVSRPSATNVADVSSWTTGRLTFSGVRLRDAVAEVNRYSDRKVVLDAPEAVAGELVSGQFVAGDVENFVAGAQSLYGLRVTAQTPREIRLGPS